MNTINQKNQLTHGDFVDFAQERYYVIRNVDKMKPFFISVISNVDHWLFVSSGGGLTAGRVSPKTALFPYITVDKIHESTSHTGCKTLFRVGSGDAVKLWEPFNKEHDGIYSLSRNIYKNVLGNKLVFEEINHSLNLTFRYSWNTSDRYGFVRQSELSNDSEQPVSIEMVDGLRNLLPAGTPAFAQTNTSNLVDAYKWSELDAQTGLAYLSLYSGISDRAEPCESLKATTVFSLGLEQPTLLISAKQLGAFREGASLEQETHTRGMRGAYFVNTTLTLAAGTSKQWRIVADLEKDQNEVVSLRSELQDPAKVDAAITESVEAGSKELEHIMAKADGFQETAEENVSVHHYANVVFNVLRGGIFDNQYSIPAKDYAETVRHFNSGAFERNQALFEALPDHVSLSELLDTADKSGDAQLVRLTYEYLPITFGRRHGDPSRPWNQFAIKVKDENDDRVLSYEGNWRDIFQNWEALLFSYPGFTEGVIAKFVNASTVEGYNPYRITKEGIDWEVEEPDNPWSYIGYWGDHQIIYLQKLLELSRSFDPERLQQMLHARLFSYANVPYRIKSLDDIIANPKQTVEFDNEQENLIAERVAEMGADGKLVLTQDGDVHQVNLLEKLLVPLLSKLSNLVVDGGIWLNTQRPEWNDANNALVGHGLSLVTLCYLRRYLHFFKSMVQDSDASFEISASVANWHHETSAALAELRSAIEDDRVDDRVRYKSLIQLGKAACRYRTAVYAGEISNASTSLAIQDLQSLIDSALVAVDRSIATNSRDDKLFNAYRVAQFKDHTLSSDALYPMLEGQVAALSSGAMSAENAVEILDALFASDIYRPDQNSFMLYPDRDLSGFLERNQIAGDVVAQIPVAMKMLETGDESIFVKDVDGCVRFSGEFKNRDDVKDALSAVRSSYGEDYAQQEAQILALYEEVFDHRSFTGRSGTMFGFEGLGSIYWHMVAKLLLAVGENFYNAASNNTDAELIGRLGTHYYEIRRGLGFNKSPHHYGAFPTDPYSHSPKHAGARQPGMTGQVKEEIVARFLELGVLIKEGRVEFRPSLLREREFTDAPHMLRFLDVDNEWQTIDLPSSSLAFTWCQVPVVYRLNSDASAALTIKRADGSADELQHHALEQDLARHLFSRNGEIRQITVHLNREQLFGD